MLKKIRYKIYTNFKKLFDKIIKHLYTYIRIMRRTIN